MIIVTHAQSQHHVDKKVGGWYDTGLTELGKNQADLISGEVKRLYAQLSPRIYSSDLKRAYETALPLSEEFNSPIHKVHNLREMSYGDAEGKDQAWLDERFVPPPAEGDRMNHQVCKNAESRLQFVERIYGAMDQIYSESEDDCILVSHGFAHTFIISWWIGLPIEKTSYVHFASSSGGITILEEDDFFHNRNVAKMNLVDHLS